MPMQDVTAALRSDLFTRRLPITVQQLGQTILLTGHVANFYQKQMVQVVVMRSLGEQLKEFDLRNEIVVD